MDFAILILISAATLVVLALLFGATARALRIPPFRWSFAVSYLLYLIMFFTWLSIDPPSTIAWQTLVPVALALPTSVLVVPFGRMGGDSGFWIFLGCFGSIQYFFIGMIAERIFKRKQDANKALLSNAEDRARERSVR